MTRSWLSDRRSAIAWTGCIVIAAWLLHPILAPAHVEGFSASIVSIAHHIQAGNIWDFDRIYPVDAEYFGLVKLGANLFVALGESLSLTGERSMRLMMWVGFACLIAGSCVLVLKWSASGLGVALLTLLLLPGVPESAFFYNDNVLSAGVCAISLALMASTNRIWLVALAGVLFGFSVVVRTDSVLLALAVPLILYERSGYGRESVTLGIIFGAGAVATLCGILAAFGITPFDVLHVANYVIELWDRGRSVRRHVREAAYFVGVPAAVCIPIGIYAMARGGKVIRAVGLVSLVLLYNLVLLGNVWQSRQLLPLTPFLATFTAAGLQHVMSTARARRPIAVRNAVAGIAALVLLAPPFGMRLDDGPRTVVGRIWTPLVWRQWQNAVTDDLAAMGHWVSGISKRRTVAVLTDHWNSDRFLHFVLLERGYSLEDAGAADMRCARAGETFRAGDRTVIHIRLHVPFVRGSGSFNIDRLKLFGVPCLDAAQVSDVFLLSSLTTATTRLGNQLPQGEWIEEARWREALRPMITGMGLGATAVVKLTPARMAQLQNAYVRDAIRYRNGKRAKTATISTLKQAEDALEGRLSHSGEPYGPVARMFGSFSRWIGR